MAAARSNSFTNADFERGGFVTLDPHINYMENQFNTN